MAIADTYNGDLIKFRQKVPAESSQLTTEATACMEEAYGIINNRLKKDDITTPIASPDEMLKTIEAYIAAGLFREMRWAPTEASPKFPREWRDEGMKMLEDWIETNYGPSSDDAEDYAIHTKVERRAHPAASQWGDDRYIINDQEGS